MSEPVKTSLPAFACVGDVVDLWPATEGLSYSEANAEGRERAEQLLEIMRRTDSPAILGHVAEAMARRCTTSGGCEFGGVEVGFFHVLAIALMQSPVVEFVEVLSERPFPVGAMRGCMRVVA